MTGPTGGIIRHRVRLMVKPEGAAGADGGQGSIEGDNSIARGHEVGAALGLAQSLGRLASQVGVDGRLGVYCQQCPTFKLAPEVSRLCRFAVGPLA